MTPIVSKLKGEKMFFVALYMLRQILCHLAPPCPFHLPCPSFSDVAEARSYVAATVRVYTASKPKRTPSSSSSWLWMLIAVCCVLNRQCYEWILSDNLRSSEIEKTFELTGTMIDGDKQKEVTVPQNIARVHKCLYVDYANLSNGPPKSCITKKHPL
jgi:hypothetical protein